MRFGTILSLAAMTTISGMAMSASAATLAYEGFTGYPNANNNIVGQNGGTGWGAAWNSGTSEGFLHTVRTPSTIAYAGYTGSTTPAASGGNYLNLAAGFGAANPANVFRFLDVTGGGTFGAAGYVSGGKIGADNTTLWASLLLSSQANSGGANGSATITFNSTTANNVTLPQSQASNLVVFKFVFGPGSTDTVTTFANPNLATFDGTSGGVTSAAGDYAFTGLTLTESYTGGSGSPGAETRYDDIRFGTTLADVAPVAAVPEPTTLAAIGGVALLTLRRRSSSL